MKIKPCPFCGGEAVAKEHKNRFTEWWIVSCPNCHVSQTGNSYEFKFEAVDEWNKRAGEHHE